MTELYERSLVEDQDIVDFISKQYETNYFPSIRFGFIKNHNGLRPGKIHLLLGTTGTGKSTVARTILEDAAKDHKVYFLSTEETRNDLLYLFDKRKTDKKILESIDFDTETHYMEACGKDADTFLLYLEERIRNIHNLKLFMLDNLTTSVYYAGKSPATQEMFFLKLKEIAAKTNVAFFLVAHTMTGVGDHMGTFITGDHIRGSKMPSIKSEYLYTFTRLYISEEYREYFFPFVKVYKSRLGNNSYKAYSLKFNEVKKEYYEDKCIRNDELMEAYKLIARLK